MHKRIYGIERETAFIPNEVHDAEPNEVKRLVDAFRPREQGGVAVMPPLIEMLPNGGRLYCDIGDHFEIATAECDSARDAVMYDKADLRILERIARQMSAPIFFSEKSRKILRQKGGATFLNISAGSRAGSEELRRSGYCSQENYMSFGTHLNVMASSRVRYRDALTALAPFPSTSCWFSGSGLLWVRKDGTMSFSLSQRAPFLDVLEGSSASSTNWTQTKPLFLCRTGEGHADSKRHFRIHIAGMDSCMHEWPTYLLLWGCGLILRMLEDGFIRGIEYEEDHQRLLVIARNTAFWGNEAAQFWFRGEQHTVTSLHRKYYLGPMLRYKASGVPWSDEEEDGLQKYQFLLDLFEKASSSFERAELFASFTDWAAKLYYWILPDMRRNGYGWDTPPGEVRSFSIKSGRLVEQTIWARIKLFDNFYHDVRRDRGLYYILEREGLVERVIADDTLIATAEECPPRTTRAHGRTERLKALYQNMARDITPIKSREWRSIKYRPANNSVGVEIVEDNPDPFDPDPGAFRKTAAHYYD